MPGTSEYGEPNHEYLLKVLESSRQKLLDLTRRNRLLSYRETGRDIAIIDEMADLVFEDLVLNSKAFYLDFMDEDESDDSDLFNRSEPVRTLPSTDNRTDVDGRYQDNLLQTPFSEKELGRRLRRLFQEHRTMIEETGANSLFVAMGFLEWSDNETDEKTVRAPLLLVPVKLVREGVAGNAKYSLSFDDGALDTNYSLVEKLKNDFDINFPSLEEEEKPESYWQRVDNAISRKKLAGWKVAHEMALGLFRFNKQVMWHDLNPTRWPDHAPLVDKKVLKRILIGPKEGEQEPGQLFEEYRQDDGSTNAAHSQISLIRDADSSQYSALIDSLNCDTGLVIEGPPGTGKSQTITNLIASALGQGLSVLFVAEKMAALDVVHKRLDESGLAPFCLQLHGLKTNKKELLSTVAERIELRAPSLGTVLHEESRLKQSRAGLIEYSKALSECVGPEDLPLYDVIWRLERLRSELPDDIDDLVLDIKVDTDYQTFSGRRNQLDDFGKEWSAISVDARIAWEGFVPTKFNSRLTEGLVTSLRAVISSSRGAGEYLDGIQENPPPPTLKEAARLFQLAALDPKTCFIEIPIATDAGLVRRVIATDALEGFGDLLAQIKQYLHQAEEINNIFDYSAESAVPNAELLNIQCQLFAGIALEPNVAINQLNAQNKLFSSVLVHLASLPEDGRYVLEILNKVARTLADYASLVKELDELVESPPELSLHANPLHAKTSINNYLQQALEEFKQISEAQKSLSNFLLHKAGSANQAADALTSVEQHLNSFFPFFNSEYRQARSYLKSLLRDKKTFKRTDDFVEQIKLFRDYLEQCELYLANKDFKAALGTLFDGMNTEWDKLEKLITYSQALRNKVGPEFSSKILGDWNTHLDLFTDTRQKIERSLQQIKRFSESHPFPQQLWQKPINEISSTILPWVEKLQYADHSLNQGWCQPDTTLEGAQKVVTLFNNTRSLESEIEALPTFSELMDGKWEKSDTDYKNIHAAYDWIAGMLSLPGMNMEILLWLFEDRSLNVDQFLKLLEHIQPFRSAWYGNQNHLQQYGNLDEERWLGGATNRLEHIETKLESSVSTISSLPLIERWGAASVTLKRDGFEQITQLVSKAVLKDQQCGKAYEYILYSKILESKITSNELLSDFTHSRYESIRERFAELDRNIAEINAGKIIAKLAKGSVSNGNGSGPVGTYTQKRLLVHEANKKARHIPIRQLVKRSGEALKALKPCFLMSPLSVAQYLSPGDIHFDLVVMDEASQLRPEDALGAIARADKAIIVGDPKQLPPTSFFDAGSSAEDDPDEATVIDDTEAILDVCLKQFPYRRLRWHYRSEHESLIQFSNEQFYDGDLIIFPSPKPESRDYGVHINYIDAPSYKRGRNRREAEIIVENIVHHFHHHAKKSLGVAAFNKVQAEEISLLLEKARQRDPLIDSLIRDHQHEEPLFIKNLENVQGDERDVIFISTTYGPEEPGGPVAQRFGPINSDIGWRRLNVIATRAKQRVEIFTSMRPTDIRIGEGARRGVRSLRDYLEFADTGRIPERGTSTGKEPDSEFEVSVMRHLSNLGYECEPQVGVAGFYIDIGVKNPDRPGEYLLGIECDGATYHSSHSVRDRDRLRQEILDRKGWYLHRIWSTSWFHTRSAELDRLKRIIESKLEEDRRTHVADEDFEQKPEVILETPPVTEEEILFEQQEESLLLEEALERFWEKNIKPLYPDRNRSILSERMIEVLVTQRPASSEEWFNLISQSLRQAINPDEGEFRQDVFEIISEYG